jgi:ABC-type dipeptide/oligopeptide/nickel transport system ATPase component
MTAAPHTPLLRIEDLAVSFPSGAGGRFRAVDGVGLAVYPKQTLAIVGESGCGKSVTAMSVLGLVKSPPARVDSGRILFRSQTGEIDLLSIPSDRMRRVRGGEIAMIFQEPMTSLNPVLSVGDQITEAVRLHRGFGGGQAKRAAVEAMEAVGIRDAGARLGAHPHQFSGGMRQRVMIAMALACEPALLLADEPTTALDVTIQKQILDLIASLKESRGMSVVLITHDLGVVAAYADVVCVMYAGRVVEYAATAELYRAPLHPYTRALLECIPTLDRAQPVGSDLATVAGLLGSEPEWNRLASDLGLAPGSVRSWWPTHAEAATRIEPGAAAYTLAEVSPGHWVGLWRTRAVETGGGGIRVRPVDLAARRGPVPVG